MSLIGLYLDSEDAAWATTWGCTSAAGTVLPMQTPSANVTLVGTNAGEVRDGFTVCDFVPVVPITLRIEGMQYSLPAGVVSTVMRRKIGAQAARWMVSTDAGVPAGATTAPVTGASASSAASAVQATGAAVATAAGAAGTSAAGSVAASVGVVVTATVTGVSGTSTAGAVTASVVTGPADVLTFGALAGTTTATTSGGYQSLASTSSGWDSGAGSPNKKLQADPASPVYFDILIPSATAQVSFGLHTDKTTAVTVFSCAYVCYMNSRFNAFGSGVTVPGGTDATQQANDTFQFLRTAGAGTDTVVIQRKRSGGSFVQVGTVNVASDADLYPRIGFNNTCSGIVVACNGAAA